MTTDNYKVGLDAPIGRQNNGAIPHSARRLDSFGEVYFSGLRVGHGDTSNPTRDQFRYHRLASTR